MKNNSILEQFNLNHLVPYNDIKLVDHREFYFPHQDKMTCYQVHDKALHHIARADTIEMAKLIVDSINFYYASL